MKIEESLDKLHQKITEKVLLQIFTAFTRILLVVGFVPPSITKILNQPFTVLPDSHPVGHYFNALYQTGFYYQFIGWSQLIAAVLLIFPRTAHLGALMFFPIILNIAVLTSSVGFDGTWLITIMMTLAALYLVCWDYDRLKPILFRKRVVKVVPFRYSMPAISSFFGLGGIGVFLFFNLVLANGFGSFWLYQMISLIFVGIVFGFAVWLHFRFMKTGKLDSIDKKL